MAAPKKPFDATNAKARNLTGPAVNIKLLKTVAPRRVSKPAAKTAEHRLEDKAAAADTNIFPPPSLGQMSREARRKLLFG
jgi:hypothetical protein